MRGGHKCPPKGMGKRYRVDGGRRASFCPDSLIAHLLIDLLAYSKVTWLVWAELSLESVSPVQWCLWTWVLAMAAR